MGGTLRSITSDCLLFWVPEGLIILLLDCCIPEVVGQ